MKKMNQPLFWEKGWMLNKATSCGKARADDVQQKQLKEGVSLANVDDNIRL